ncbi:hypothetical protein DMC47_42575 [Nostoc sp. 3335mG]|nr:hypothetical protein DMC47_42575 [Nostoc sp. 3335mG]
MGLLLASLIALFAAPAMAVPVAPQAPTGPEVVLDDFQTDGMSDYRIDGTRGIYVLAANDGRWYYLHVEPSCSRLAGADGFDVTTYGPDGRLDRDSLIRAQGQVCHLTSVTPSPVPPGYKTLK